jgi:hypothetical protein
MAMFIAALTGARFSEIRSRSNSIGHNLRERCARVRRGGYRAADDEKISASLERLSRG